MPQNCFVPYCSKKLYKEVGKKISFHKYPKDTWIKAIQREVGCHFQITNNTHVCLTKTLSHNCAVNHLQLKENLQNLDITLEKATSSAVVDEDRITACKEEITQLKLRNEELQENLHVEREKSFALKATVTYQNNARITKGIFFTQPI